MTVNSKLDNPLPKVTIIGAGVCGLLLAHGVQKLGFPVSIIEKDLYVAQRSREWTMTIHWGLSTLKEMLPPSVLSEMRTAHTDPSYEYDVSRKETIPFYNGYNGDLVMEAGHVFRRVSRTRLREVLSKGLDIHWGTEVTGIAYGEDGIGETILHFKGPNGIITREKTDILIGADGPSSFVRRWLVGDELSKPKLSRYAIGTGIVKFDDPEVAKALRPAAYPLAMNSSLPSGFIFSAIHNVPDPTDPSTWSFHVMHLWRPSELESDNDTHPQFPSLEGPAAIAKVKDAISSPDLKEPFRSSIQAIPDDSPFWVSQLRYWDTVPWDRSKMVTLVGDAAHAVLPARGQGLNHGLGDIEKLIAEFKLVKLGEQSPANALDAYHDDVFVRGPRAALESLEDADAISKIHDLTDSRVNRNGLAA